MKQRQALVWLLVAGLVFGALVAVMKGQDVDARNALGNTSAPWVVVPFLAGMRYRRVWHGALVGVATTMAALLGFYVAEAAVLDLGTQPGAGLPVDVGRRGARRRRPRCGNVLASHRAGRAGRLSDRRDVARGG